MAVNTYNLYFTGKDDPRDCVIIGEDTKPVYIIFETKEIPTTRTTVSLFWNKELIYKNHTEVVAWFDWLTGNHLGRAYVQQKPMPMSQLVQPVPNGRVFVSGGQRFEWRRSPEDLNSYDLYSPDARIAFFRKRPFSTPIGPAHAVFQYTFPQGTLLLDALMALCLCRWIDWRGM